MKILLLVSSFNSLTQSVYCKLNELAYDVCIEFAISKEQMIKSVDDIKPDLIFCPYLKEYIPKEIFENYDTFILHPGIIGDRGANSLDYAIRDGVKNWGVVILKAHEDLDAGDIYAYEEFPMEKVSKSSIYRNQVNKASLKALENFLLEYTSNTLTSTKQILNPIHKIISQGKREINWEEDSALEIMKKINMSDSFPGVKDEFLGIECFLYGASLEEELKGKPKEVIAKRDGAICIGTIDQAIWISHIKEKDKFKLPSTYVLKDKIKGIQEKRLPLIVKKNKQTYHEISIEEKDEVCYLYFNFYNGAMNSAQAIRLKYAIDYLKEEYKILVLMGGDDFFSNGIHLNILEDSKKQGEDGWSNINAMNDVVKSILLCDDIITVASFHKNAGAGGVFLGLACDYILGCENTVLNPHYKTLGLSGSEYHTYTLEKRIGALKAKELLDSCLPINLKQAKEISMIDEVFKDENYQSKLEEFCFELLENEDSFDKFIDNKKDRLFEEEEYMESCKEKELKIMYDEFWDKNSSFHTLRKDFVYKRKVKQTPKRLKGFKNA